MRKHARAIKHQKRGMTLMMLPHSGAEIRSVELTLPVLIGAIVLLSGIVFSAVFFPYKYFSASIRAQRGLEAARAEDSRYAALSESIKQVAATETKFSTELNKTISILSESGAGGMFGSAGGSASAVLSGGLSPSEFDQEGALFTIAQRLNKNIPILKDINDSLAKQDDLLRQLPVYWPVPNSSITMEWGPNIHPVFGYWYLHKGIDMAALTGTPIYSVADGIVTEAGFDPGYGLNVYVSHSHGFKSHYSHMSAISVREGQLVKQGQRMGAVGSTGLVTGPHLDLQLYLGEDLVDPGVFMRMLHAAKYNRPVGNR